MTHEEEIALHDFEALVRRLMAEHRKMRAENAQLKEALAKCQQDLADTQKAVDEAQRKYGDLKTARMIEVSGGDIKESRARITRLIREVDKCIALLDV